MEKYWLLAMLLFLFALSTTNDASFLDTHNWISIDCGAENARLAVSNLINWETDAEYIKTGVNKIVTAGNNITEQMKTLRYFPDGDSNCYSFPTEGITKYVVRAGFYYGNYDGLSKPPSFDLLVNGFKWATVVTSLTQDLTTHEAIFRPASESMSVCLVRTQEDQIPFISSLEVTPLPNTIYMQMELWSAYVLQSRSNLGGKDDIGYTGNSTDDEFNRIWKATGLPTYSNVSNSSLSWHYDINQPPYSVVTDAIEATRPSDSIVVPIDLPQTPQSVLCVMFYLAELSASRGPNDSRKFQIGVNGHENTTLVDLQTGDWQFVILCPVRAVGRTNVTLSPVEGSTLPPILNAMEVYTVHDMERPTPAAPSLAGRSRPSLLFHLLVSLLFLGYISVIIFV